MPPSQVSSRQPRLHFASFNGTWAGGVLNCRKTVVSVLPRLVSDDENVVETLVNGVGSDISLFDQLAGGVGGWGTLRNVTTAYKNLANHYHGGDRIILCGYSRGAWAARYLAMLIAAAGLPRDGDEKLFHDLYKACDKHSVPDKAVIAQLFGKYECWTDVKIDALCCFDTVGSMGLPVFGVAKPLSLLRRQKRRADTDIAENVRFSFHCLALNETRSPFSPTLMRGDNVHQLFFPGNHGDMGWVEDAEGFVHAPLAWIIQQLRSHLGISFDDDKLKAYFPRYCSPPLPPRRDSTNPATSPALSRHYTWCNGLMARPSLGLLAIIGKKIRQPGLCIRPAENKNDASNLEAVRDASRTNATTTTQLHIGARLRLQYDDQPVPGYKLVTPETGPPYWARSGGDSGESKVDMADWIEEAAIGPLEASLLGLPDHVVTDAFCCEGCYRKPLRSRPQPRTFQSI